ncbi:endonuclease V isoform X1 [Cucurbita moschata]|uniref:Endonuclease V isoform X1 n=1 Tax=Cucurbita moschata TaxID=3662 RepID=A0A6J1ESH8_CUCMO|nr:endonuclease V isoform X1 [Cucurbita moschata]
MISEEEKQVKSYPEAATTSSVEIQNWIEAQDLLKKKLIKEDEFEGDSLKYVGGVDISFLKEDSSVACGTLVVLNLQTLQVVYEDFSLVTVQDPYVPGFLAFREAPVLLELLERMKKRDPHLYPQLLLVDGNGILHPRGFGLASHLGVLANLPTIGIGKNLHHVDGLTHSGVRRLLSESKNNDSVVTLRGTSGCIWGVAMRSTADSLKPIYISIGHRVSLDTAIRIVKSTCKFRVPEPIRQADIRSREYLRKFQMGMLKRETS